MTDLCMEPEAESKCNELIDYSLQLDDNNNPNLIHYYHQLEFLNKEHKKQLKHY